jgi:hypothetical protein
MKVDARLMLTPPGAQYGARQGKETGLDMGDLHTCASPGNSLWLTRNEFRKAVRVRSSALYFTCKTFKKRRDHGHTTGVLGAVGQH